MRPLATPALPVTTFPMSPHFDAPGTAPRIAEERSRSGG
jgi:hypothetical protein